MSMHVRLLWGTCKRCLTLLSLMARPIHSIYLVFITCGLCWS
jgi:hypothetical protein